MWSDNETTVDYLNFGIIADACTELLQKAKGEPISIGVSGGWGAGKTSLVRMIEERLKAVESHGDNKYVVITFNPWLYQDFDSSRNALLQIVGDEILRLAQGNDDLYAKAKGLLHRINLLKVVQLGAEAAITLHTGIPVGIFGRAALKMRDAFLTDTAPVPVADGAAAVAKTDGLIRPPSPVSLPNEIQAFRDALEELLKELKITLVVFVDDLDRCLPKTAISTLESIRLLLFLKRSAFVIAADNEFIRGAVNLHFEGTQISKDVATNYFDKLIQVPLHVPRLGINESTAYLALLLMERELKEGNFEKAFFDNAVTQVSARLKSSWKGDAVTIEFLESLVVATDSRMVALMKLAQGLAPLLTRSSAVNANPRLMKRFLNTVYLRAALAVPQEIELDIPALAKWHLLERCDSELANALGSQVNADSEGRVEALRIAEDKGRKADYDFPAPFKDEPFTREWLDLEPTLGEMDLRPLLHLSRDSATRDFGADQMNAVGRSLRDALVNATSFNQQLTEAIRSAGEAQAGKAMLKAWEIKAHKRSWKSSDELIPLEPATVFPSLTGSAEQLLRKAPIELIGPGLIPKLGTLDWAKPILNAWSADKRLDEPTKRAIDRLKDKK